MNDGDQVVIRITRRFVAGTVIHVYDRDTILPPTSAPTFRNMALAIFNQNPQISRVALMSSAGPLVYFLWEASHCWFDITGAPVQMMQKEPQKEGFIYRTQD